MHLTKAGQSRSTRGENKVPQQHTARDGFPRWDIMPSSSPLHTSLHARCVVFSLCMYMYMCVHVRMCVCVWGGGEGEDGMRWREEEDGMRWGGIRMTRTFGSLSIVIFFEQHRRERQFVQN